jgi:FMN-dependent oxidoreductase (nitrilotriacetate monooxygenase family)
VTDYRYPDARVHFGVFFQGVNHWTVWSELESGSQIDFSSFRKMITTAERGLFDAFFLGEGLRLRESDGHIHDLDIAGRPDAITQLAALAAITERIGLVATQNTTFNEPADLAHRLAGLDALSGGRAGWNVVTTDNAWTGENFRRGGFLDHADRYLRAGQFLDVARAVWDSWADDWAGPDGTGWSRPGAITPVRARTAQFDVDVTPTLPRSAQGHPVIFQAGDSSDGREFAAQQAEVIFSAHGSDFDDALAFADDIRARLVAVGRPEDDIRILPGTEIVIADTGDEAQEKLRRLRMRQVTKATALAIAGQVWGKDLSDRDADGPLPADDPVVVEPTGTMGSRRWRDPRAIVQQWRDVAEAEKLTLRETVIRLGPQRGHVGTASELADRFAHWVRSGAVSGFNVSPYSTPDGLDDIVEKLVPELQERGAYPASYTGRTLREHLGLRPPLTGRG